MDTVKTTVVTTKTTTSSPASASRRRLAAKRPEVKNDAAVAQLANPLPDVHLTPSSVAPPAHTPPSVPPPSSRPVLTVGQVLTRKVGDNSDGSPRSAQCTVESEEGVCRYDGKLFASLTAAGKACALKYGLKGKVTNGAIFWSLKAKKPAKRSQRKIAASLLKILIEGTRLLDMIKVREGMNESAEQVGHSLETARAGATNLLDAAVRHAAASQQPKSAE